MIIAEFGNYKFKISLENALSLMEIMDKAEPVEMDYLSRTIKKAETPANFSVTATFWEDKTDEI